MLESHFALRVVGKIILIINNHLKFYDYTKPASDSIANGAKCVLIKRVLITFPSSTPTYFNTANQTSNLDFILKKFTLHPSVPECFNVTSNKCLHITSYSH